MHGEKQAVILAGGKGTRLKSISGNLPKPMVHVLGKPLLLHLIEQCVKYNILNIHLLISYRSEVIEKHFGNGSQYGVSIQYHTEVIPRGTAGALLDITDQLNEQFLVIYGDTYFDVDLDHFWAFHQNNNGDATLFLHPNDHPQDSDLVEVDEEKKIKAIHTYPHANQWQRNLVNAALYMMKRSSLAGIELSSERPDIAKHLFPSMVESCKSLFGYISTEYIKDMGTPERLERVEQDISSGKVQSLSYKNRKKALFLDRDGVINHEVDHLSSLEQFELLDGVGNAIRQANRSGILVVVVTNQPVIARGELSEAGLREIHNKMDTLLGQEGAYIDGLYYCPHHTDGGYDSEIAELKVKCNCRKPNAGLFQLASEELNISMEDSWMVGDSTSDMLAAKRAGVKGILVKTGYAGNDGKYDCNPEFIVDDLVAAVALITKEFEK
jgi:D,D-heptose 1,7-bisphosphate phosphatase